MNTRLKLIFALIGTLQSSVLFAEKSYVSISGAKTQDKSQADSSKGVDDVTILQGTFAYGFAKNLVLGAKYFNYSQDNDFLTNDHTVISGYGPLLGFLHESGFFVNATYLISPSKVYKDSAGQTTYQGGSGYVIDIGKFWEFGGSFGGGLQFSQSHVDYKEVKNSGATTNLQGPWWDDSFYPYISLFYFF